MKYIISLLIVLCLSTVATAKELIVVGADWCPYCVKQKQYMKDNPDVIKNFDMEYIDVDKNPELRSKLNIKVFPSSFIFDDNHRKVGALRGFTPAKFNEWIKRYE